jgi:hypothetical protein
MDCQAENCLPQLAAFPGPYRRFAFEMLHFEGKYQKQHFRKQHSVWYPSNPFQIGSDQSENLWIHPPKIEDFYQQFMGSFLACSVETVFQENDLQEVHTVIDKEMA